MGGLVNDPHDLPHPLFRERRATTLDPYDQSDHPCRRGHGPHQVNPRKRIVFHPSGIDGAEIRHENRRPEEQRLGARLRVPETFDRRGISDERQQLHQGVRQERLFGDKPEQHYSCSTEQAPTLHRVKGQTKRMISKVRG